MRTKKYVGKQFTHKTNGSVVLVVNCMHHNTDGELIVTENQQSGCVSHLPFKNFKANYQPVQREHKHIKYAIVDVTEDGVEVQITEQTCINEKFGEKGNVFTASSEIMLISDGSPENHIPLAVFVRGNYSQYDDNVVVFSHSDFQRFKKAIAEYNEYFKGD